jgi:hypothetical protein
MDRLAAELERSRREAPDDYVALLVRQQVWAAREKLRLELEASTDDAL